MIIINHRKSVRSESVHVTVGLWNATLLLSEKGFYAMAFILSLFAVITIQKNTRDLNAIKKHSPVFLDHEEE